MSSHLLMGGKLHVYKRDNSRYWQCSTYIGGKNQRTSTKAESLAHAKEVAEDWYLELRGKHKRGELKKGKSFNSVADQFEREYEIITLGERNKDYVEAIKIKLRLYLRPFFGDKAVHEITPGLVQEYRIHRLTNPLPRNRKKPLQGEPAKEPAPPKPPSRSTLHKEIVVIRQVLKTAVRHRWLEYVPDLSPPYKTSGKITHRAWFSPEEYRQLYEATRKRALKPKRKRYKWQSEQMHDYVLFMANTGLRPDEASRLEFRDVKIVVDETTEQTILEIEVRGKRGVGYCKSMPGAVRPFERLKERNDPEPTDRLFPKGHRELFNTILDEQKLKFDRDGKRRTAYSLRHTYICLRLMEGADIYQIAKNCRTSVEMIEKFYAAHLKTTIDAAAINVRRVRPTKKDDGQAAQMEPAE